MKSGMFSLSGIYFLLHRLILVVFSLNYTEKAVDSARSARKKRWICFFIFLVVLIEFILFFLLLNSKVKCER